MINGSDSAPLRKSLVGFVSGKQLNLSNAFAQCEREFKRQNLVAVTLYTFKGKLHLPQPRNEGKLILCQLHLQKTCHCLPINFNSFAYTFSDVF